MNKQMTMILVIVALIALAGGGFYLYQSSSANLSAIQAIDKHEDGTIHTEGDSHVQDESKPHTDATPHPVDESQPHFDATPHASSASESTSSGRRPAAVDDHVDSAPHAEDEPHN